MIEALILTSTLLMVPVDLPPATNMPWDTTVQWKAWPSCNDEELEHCYNECWAGCRTSPGCVGACIIACDLIWCEPGSP